jgi:hypothetical protein
MSPIRKIIVQDTEIAVSLTNGGDFICITDMIKAKDGNFFITDWLRNRNTLEYLATWEVINNPNFNYGEFATIRNSAGLNSFKISVKEWVARTNAIGISSKAGRYGGTYAHKDIAFQFGMWISPAFQLYVVKEYQLLKEQENNPLTLQWNVKRILSKTNYQLHTDAIKENLLPTLSIDKQKEYLVYADEADLLNLALFGCRAKDWSESNPALALQNLNIRDTASINQLVVLANIESFNSELIKRNVSREERFSILQKMAQEQLSSLEAHNAESNFRKLTDTNISPKELDIETI